MTLLLFFGVLALLVWVISLRDRVRQLEERGEELSNAVLRLQLLQSEQPLAAGQARAPAGAAAEQRGPGPRPAEAREGTRPPQPPPVAPRQPTPRAPSPPAIAPSATAAGPPPPARPTPPAAPTQPGMTAPPPPAAPPRTTVAPHTTAPPPVTPPYPAAAPPPPPPSQPFDWEALVGVKLFSWIAGIALALAAIFFLRYSIQSGWLQPPVRVAIGILVGVALLVVCELRVARTYAVTANAMDAAGIVILFSTFFAAYSLWHLLTGGATFLLLILVTAVAVMLSIRRDSVFVALLGLVGGFSTPALLSTGQDNPMGLFGYLLLLDAGLAWVAYRKRWVALVALSLLFTTFYQWAWVLRFLSAGRLPLAGGIFLVFPLLGVLATAALSGGPEGAGADRSGFFGGDATSAFARLVAINASLPLLFALYLASVPAYGQHLGMLFGFLLILDAGLLAIARWRGPAVLHALGALSTVLVFLAWFSARDPVSAPAGSWPAILGFVALFVVFYLAAGLVVRHRWTGAAGAAGAAEYAAPVLVIAFPILAATEPAFAEPGLAFAVLFGLIALIAAYAIVERAGALHFIAAFLALVTEAVWSGLHLTPGRLLPGLGVYAVFGLFYLGVPLVARQYNRPLEPQGMPALVLVVSVALLFFLASGSLAPTALWGLALLLAILNLALFVEGGASRRPRLAAAGSALSWMVLVAWWLSGALAAQATAALMIVGGFGLLTIGGHLWLARQAGDTSKQNGLGLALVGHLFLFFVAAQPSLSTPPWPMLGVLFVLDLAIATAAIAVGAGEMQLAAMVLTQGVIAVWMVSASATPWPAVAVVSAAAAAALGLGFAFLSRRRLGAPSTEAFDTGAAAGLVLAQLVAVLSLFTPGTPDVLLLVVIHASLTIAILALSSLGPWPGLATIAVVPAWLGPFTWLALHPEPAAWQRVLAFAVPLHAIFLAYPLVLGAKVERRIQAHLAAVASSAAFFFVARAALIAGGYGAVIGLLPVVQAALLGVLLVALLRLEPRGGRTMGRLALVAGAVLAFVTVAIPLQLEKEWITIGWALEGAALAWLYRRIPHRGLFWTGFALLAIVFVRLAVNPEVLVYEPRGALRIFNWYLYSYLSCAGAMIVASRLLATTDDRTWPELPRASSILPAEATVLLFLLLNIEIADFFSTGASITFNLSAGIAQDLTYTLGWGAFAVGLLTVGILRQSHLARLAAIALLTVTVLKGFLHDMARLGGLYRVVSFVGLAICLSLVALVLQRFVLQRRSGSAE